MAEGDGIDLYMQEKLWELIPAVYREEDGLAAPVSDPRQPHGVLRSYVRLLAREFARVRRSHDRLWEDMFVDLCDDWALPYLGDLLGTRLVSALNPRGRRADVAKTIYYRRRSGTPAVLEELIADITGWDGTVVEMFRRLARLPHGLDPPPLAHAGTFSGTLPGGLPDLRRPRAAELAGGPFDEFHHLPDVRRHQGGVDGRHNIPKLAVHLYRLVAYELTDVVPYQVDAQSFVFDPSGREIPLFVRADRAYMQADRGIARAAQGAEVADFSEWRRAREWELPAPMPCRLLGHAEYRIDEALVAGLGLSAAPSDELRTLIGTPFRDEASLRLRLAELPAVQALLAATPGLIFRILAAGLIPDCGKSVLLARSVSVEAPAGTRVPPEQIAAADLSGWSAATDKAWAIDPEHGRLRAIAPPAAALDPRGHYHYGFSGPVGAGPYRRAVVEAAAADRRSGGGALTAAQIALDRVTQIDDNRTYGPLPDLTALSAATIQAADGARPYLRLAADWVLEAAAGADKALTLDGLWIGGAGDVVLRGSFASVRIAHATLDPGGVSVDGKDIRPVRLIVEGSVGELRIEAAITGPILTRAGGSIDLLRISDSIVQELDPATTAAVALGAGLAKLRRVTVLGPMQLCRLDASEVLATGKVEVADVQTGCFRFGVAGVDSHLPHPYRSMLLADTAAMLVSQRFGHPGYAQISLAAPEALRRGAESGSEIGAFSGLNGPIKLDGLAAKYAEFMPFGLVPLFIMET